MYKPGKILYNAKILGVSAQEANDKLVNLFGYWSSKDRLTIKTSEQKVYTEAEKESLKLERYKKYLDSLNN